MVESWPTIGACINMDGSSRELNPHGTADFPIACYCESVRDGKGQYVPEHWHDDLEVLTVVSGSCSFEVNGERGELHVGEGVFFNRGSRHMVVGLPHCRIVSAVFNPVIVAGMPDSVYAHRYVGPIMDRDASRYITFAADEPLHFSKHVLQAVTAERTKQPGYEFTVRDALSRCLYAVWDVMGRPQHYQGVNPTAESGRLNLMCMFVKDHLAEHFTVADIATAGGVSERECLRAFKRSLGVSPVRYVALNRLSRAAAMLACEKDMGVAEIAAQTGFSSAGYFAKLFRDEFGVTPRAYRMQVGDMAFSPRAMMAGVPLDVSEAPDQSHRGRRDERRGGEEGSPSSDVSDSGASEEELIGCPYRPGQVLIGDNGNPDPKMPKDALGSRRERSAGDEETIG